MKFVIFMESKELIMSDEFSKFEHHSSLEKFEKKKGTAPNNAYMYIPPNRRHVIYAGRWVAIENQTHSFPIFQTAS